SPSSKLGLALAVATIPLMMFFRVVFNYLNVYLVNWAAFRAIVDLRNRLFDHLQNLSLSFFSRASTGELISRISNDTLVVQSIVANAFASLIKDPISVIVLFGLMLSQQPRLTLISLLVFPLCVMPIVIYSQIAQARAASQRIFELLEMQNTIREPAQPVVLRAAGAPIYFHTVCFSYGDKVVLQDVQLTVEPGKTVALVGASGSGKTTLTN